MVTKLQKLLNELGEVQDQDERADMLIEAAEKFKEVPGEIAKRPFSESHRVPACESQVFAWVQKDDANRIYPYFAVENPQGISAKALAVFLTEILSGEPAETVYDLREDMVEQIFGRSLVMGRAAGLKSMINMIKALASRSL